MKEVFESSRDGQNWTPRNVDSLQEALEIEADGRELEGINRGDGEWQVIAQKRVGRKVVKTLAALIAPQK